MTSQPRLRLALFPAALLLGVVIPRMAYDYPLSTSQIRDAYFLGARKDGATADFFASYCREFPTTKRGPHVAAISVETPYAIVVERSGTAPNYTAQDALREFEGKRGSFRVGVKIVETPSDPAVSLPAEAKPQSPPGDFAFDTRIRLIKDTDSAPVRVEVVTPDGQ